MRTRRRPWGSSGRRRNFRCPCSERVSSLARSTQPTRSRGRNQSKYSSIYSDFVAVVANGHDKPRLVGYGSGLLAMNERSGILNSEKKVGQWEVIARKRWWSLPCAVGAESDAVKSATQFGLVLRVALQITQFVKAVGKLTFVSVFAFASFFVGTTQFRLVSGVEKGGQAIVATLLKRPLTVMCLFEVMVQTGCARACDGRCLAFRSSKCRWGMRRDCSQPGSHRVLALALTRSETNCCAVFLLLSVSSAEWLKISPCTRRSAAVAAWSAFRFVQFVVAGHCSWSCLTRRCSTSHSNFDSAKQRQRRRVSRRGIMSHVTTAYGPLIQFFLLLHRDCPRNWLTQKIWNIRSEKRWFFVKRSEINMFPSHPPELR